MAWKKIITQGGVTPEDLKELGATLDSGMSGEALVLNYDGSDWTWGTGRAAGSKFITGSEDLEAGATTNPVAGTTAEEGDLYIQSNGDMFQWNGTSWSFETNLQGAPGTASGVTGADGATGAAGATGATGADGADGAQGDLGPTGPQGSSITSVEFNDSDASGSTYEVKVTDIIGSVTIVGTFFVPAGAQGTQGVQGATGAQGTQGVQGATGPQGVQGAQGATGPQGGQGTAGTAGAQGASGNTYLPSSLTWNEASSNLTIDFASDAGSTTAVSGVVSINSTQSDSFAIGGASGVILETNNDNSLSFVDPNDDPVDIIVNDVHLGTGVVITSGGFIEIDDAFQAVNKDSITAATAGASTTEMTPTDMLSVDAGFRVYRGATDISDQASIDASLAAPTDVYWRESKGYWAVKVPKYTGASAVNAGATLAAETVNYDLHMSFTTSDPSVHDPASAATADVDKVDRINVGGFFIGGDDSIWVKTS